MRAAFLIGLMLLPSVWAAGLGMSPGRVEFTNLYVDGFAAEDALVSATQPDGLLVRASVEPASLGAWLTVEPAAFTVRGGQPQRLRITAEPGGVAPGVHEGTLLLRSELSAPIPAGDARSTVLPALAVPVRIEVTGEALVACDVGVKVLPVAEDGLLAVIVRLRNAGNVRLSPGMEVLLGEGDNILQDASFVMSALPGETIEEKRFIEHRLGQGSRWALVSAQECGEPVLVPFEVTGPRRAILQLEGVSAGQGWAGEYVPVTAVITNTHEAVVESTLIVELAMPDGGVQRLSERIRLEPGERQNLTLYFALQAGSYPAKAYLTREELQAAGEVTELLVVVRREPPVRVYLVLVVLLALAVLLLRAIRRR